MTLNLRKEGDFITPHSTEDAERLKQLNDGIYVVDMKDTSSRSLQQNAALHKLFTLTADALNDGGYTVNVVLGRKRSETLTKIFSWGYERADARILKTMYDRIVQADSTDLPWTMEKVKTLLWKELQFHVTGKTSTTKLNKQEVDKVYELYNIVLARYGVHIPFPSKELWEESKEK